MAYFDRSKGGPRGGTLRSGSGSFPAIGPGPSPSHTPLEEAPREAYFDRSKGGLVERARSDQAQGYALGHRFRGLAPATISSEPAHKAGSTDPKQTSGGGRA